MLLCAGMAVSLCACGKKQDGEESALRKERAAAVDNGSLNGDSVVVAVGKTTVTYNEYKVYDHFMKSQYEDILTQDVWTYKAGSAQKSIGQEAVEDVIRLIIQVKVITKEAQAQGVALAADEKEAADHNASLYCESLSDEVKSAQGISQAVMARVFEENKLAEKMYSIVTGKVDVNVTKEQARAARVQLIWLPFSGQNKEEVRKKAADLAARAKTLTGSFYRFAKENTQADEVEYLVGQMDERTNLASAVLGMKQYGTSDVIEEADGFYIAYCVEPVNDGLGEAYRNQVIEERQTKAFQDAYAGWAKNFNARVSKSLLAADSGKDE